MRNTLLLSAGLLLSGQVFAADMDMKQIMQEMKLEFKGAAEALSVEEMQKPITQLSQLVAQAQQGEYPPERAETYQEGFDKLAVALNRINHELESGDLEAAKHSLKEVDDLRIEYHEKKKPGIWQRLFG